MVTKDVPVVGENSIDIQGVFSCICCMHLVDFHTHSLKGSHNIDKGNNEKYNETFVIADISNGQLCMSTNIPSQQRPILTIRFWVKRFLGSVKDL